MDEIVLTLKRAIEHKDLKEENAARRILEQHRPDRLIGQSAPMQHLYRIIKRVAKTDSTVLITGESGTGKELIANAIHNQSPRRDMPFVPINCGAIPEELLESELFGHEKGAFTGAFKERRGRFELANKGTVFLDEIGEMSPKLQVKLLRFLQETKFQRVGGSRTVEVDVRILAATNKDLERAVSQSEFREDLFYRLNVIPISVPALRERAGDIALLIQHFLKQHCVKKNITQKRMSETAVSSLEQYEWPGNVRELENVIERLVILTDTEEIHVHDLPKRMQILEQALEPADVGVPTVEHVVEDRNVIPRAFLLRHPGHPPGPLGGGEGTDLCAEQLERSGSGSQESEGGADQRRLPRPVRTRQGEELPLRNVEREVVERHPISVLDRHGPEAEREFVGVAHDVPMVDVCRRRNSR
jgi:DNA-binding NtrC family response regulator